MLQGEKVLITGVSGKIAFPIARSLARDNEVWGVARLQQSPRNAEHLERLACDPFRSTSRAVTFSALPHDFTYVFHAAVDVGDR